MEPAARDRVLPLAQRAWLAIVHLSLPLPFVVTKSCANGEVQELTGLQYYVSLDRWIFLFALVVVIGALAAVPWRGERTARAAAAVGLRAWVAALGALVAIFGPLLAFLFDTPEPRVGWWIHGGGWALTALGYLALTAGLLVKGGRPAAGAAKDAAERFGIVALLVAPAAAAIVKIALDPGEPLEHALGVATGYGVCLPLVLGGVALVRALRGGEEVRLARLGWWAATILTLLAHAAAAVSD